MLVLEIAAGVILAVLVLRNWAAFVTVAIILFYLLAIALCYFFFPAQTAAVGVTFLCLMALSLVVAVVPARFLPDPDPHARPSWSRKSSLDLYREWRGGVSR